MCEALIIYLQLISLVWLSDILCSGSCIFHERRLPVKVIVEFSNKETPALFITHNCMNYQLFAQLSLGKIQQAPFSNYIHLPLMMISCIVGIVTFECLYIVLCMREYSVCSDGCVSGCFTRCWEGLRVLFLIRHVFYT